MLLTEKTLAANLLAAMLVLAPPAARAQGVGDMPILNVYAIDDLQPEISVFGSSDRNTGFVREAFLAERYRELFKEPGDLRMLAMPDGDSTPGEEFVVGLRSRMASMHKPFDSEDYTIVVLQAAESSLLNQDLDNARDYVALLALHLSTPYPGEAAAAEQRVGELQAKMSAAANKPLERCELPLDHALGQRIHDDWAAMLGRTRFSRMTDKTRRDNDDAAKARPMTAYHFSGGNEFEGSGESGFVDAPLPGTRPLLLVQTGLALRDYCKTKDAGQLAQLKSQLGALERRLKTSDAKP